VIRANRALARRGRCQLPADVLAEAGLSVHEAIAAPDSAAVKAALRRLAAEGKALLARAPSGRIPRGYVAASLPVVLARRDLRHGADLLPLPRAFADRLSVTLAGLTGRI
jgi:15-cis-phytoene synthase